MCAILPGKMNHIVFIIFHNGRKWRARQILMWFSEGLNSQNVIFKLIVI